MIVKWTAQAHSFVYYTRPIIIPIPVDVKSPYDSVYMKILCWRISPPEVLNVNFWVPEFVYYNIGPWGVSSKRRIHIVLIVFVRTATLHRNVIIVIVFFFTVKGAPVFIIGLVIFPLENLPPPPVAHACRDGLDPKLVIVVKSSISNQRKIIPSTRGYRLPDIIILCIVTYYRNTAAHKNIMFTIWVVRVCFTSRGDPGLFQLRIKTTSLFQ